MQKLRHFGVEGKKPSTPDGFFLLPIFGAMRRLFTNISHYYYLCAVFFIVLIVWLPDSGYDKYFWVSWAKYIRLHGVTEAYNNPEINYHPVILYIIKAFTVLHWPLINETNINWLKVPTAIFDWGIIFITLLLLKQHKKNLQWGLLLVFNPAFWYNTIIWGQFDSIWVFFILLAFYLADKKYFYYSTIAFVLALNTKLFALFFLPFLVLMWIRLKPDTDLKDTRIPPMSDKKTLWAIIAKTIAFQFVLILPFILYTHYSLSTIIQRSTEYYNSLSRNAYNIWYCLFNDPVNTTDTSYITASVIFVGIVFLALLFLQYKNKITVWNAVAMASIVFFLFLTRMHERYAHAALVFGFIAFSLTPQPPLPKRGGVINSPPNLGGVPRLWRGEGVLLSFLLISLAYFLNLEAVMQTANKSLGLNVDYTSILFNPKLVATLYFIACLLLAYTIILQVRNTRQTA